MIKIKSYKINQLKIRIKLKYIFFTFSAQHRDILADDQIHVLWPHAYGSANHEPFTDSYKKTFDIDQRSRKLWEIWNRIKMRTMTRDTPDWLVHVYSLTATSIGPLSMDINGLLSDLSVLCTYDKSAFKKIRMTLYRMLGF